MKRRICNEHDSLDFTDDKRLFFVEMLKMLSDEYDDYCEELADELKYFDVCGRFISDEIYDDNGEYFEEVVKEASNYAHTMPAYSDAALVYWEHIDKLSLKLEDD